MRGCGVRMKMPLCTLGWVIVLLMLLYPPVLLAEDIPLIKMGGTYRLPVEVNGILTLPFMLDPGASDVTIPADVALTLYRMGTIKDTDFLPGRMYTLADGATLRSTRFVLRSLKIGQRRMTNIPASIGRVLSPLLLGQSFLERLGSWEMESQRQVLTIGVRGQREASTRSPTSLTPTLQASTQTRITFPRDGDSVGRHVSVAGSVSRLGPDQHAFLCVKSPTWRRIWPQGKVLPDATGQWVVESIFADAGYSYETFLVITSNRESALMLSNQEKRRKGMGELPPDTNIISEVITVMRK
jgi:hypothetical protein